MIALVSKITHLEKTLAKTQQALSVVLNDLRLFSQSNQKHSSRLRISESIISDNIFCEYDELRQLGELLDQQYKDLWQQERELTAAINDPDNTSRYEEILAELDSVRQKMTEIDQMFDSTDYFEE